MSRWHKVLYRDVLTGRAIITARPVYGAELARIKADVDKFVKIYGQLSTTEQTLKEWGRLEPGWRFKGEKGPVQVWLRGHGLRFRNWSDLLEWKEEVDENLRLSMGL